MLKAKKKSIFRDCCDNTTSEYRDTIADFLNEIGIDNFISLDDDGSMTRIWYWEDDKNGDVFTCGHAHDYSNILLNGETYLEIGNDEPLSVTDEEGTTEYEKTRERVEHITKLLNRDK